jgi:6-pyruvoyltetrahydropterin/6-carboxytetrahydropterin synthase
MTMTISVSHNAEIAHRITTLIGADKCRNIHGHSLWITWTFETPDTSGRGTEFGSVKKRLRNWVDEHLDHGFVSHNADPLGHLIAERGLKVLFLPGAPTTEAIAARLAEAARAVLPALPLRSVHVSESNTSSVTWYHE